MTLSEEARERLADVVALQPTKNADLQERWGLDSGSEVHSYLESELSDYYYRDDDSLIRATPAAADVVDVDPGVEGDGDGTPTTIRVPTLDRQVFDVLAGPDGDSMSVVAVLHAVREASDEDPGVDAVRSALQSLSDKGVVERVQRAVPTYRRAVDDDAVTVETVDG